MAIIYFLTIILLLVSLYSWRRRYKTNKKQIPNSQATEENEINLNTVIEEENKLPTEEFREEKNEIRPQALKERPDLIDRPTIGKENKWLHTTDSFGKMEKGVVD